MAKRLVKNLLHKELSYAVHGAAIEVRKDFGPGHKEKLYQNAFAKELQRRNIVFEKEKTIKIFSPKNGEYIGLYRPDFVIDEKILVELKAEKFVSQHEIKRIYDYLRNANYELAYFINFSSPQLYVRRIIYTNDRKPFLKSLLASIGLILVFIGGVSKAEAASFFVESPKLVAGQETTLILNLDTENEDINAVELRLKFSPADFSVKEVNNGNSIINLWPERPSFSNDKGEIYFSGIMAGGYRGSGRLLKIIIIPRKDDLSGLKIQNAKVLLNDGSGTEARLSTFNLKFETISGLSIKDIEPPESFVPQIGRDPAIFNGEWFLVFIAQDKGSGIDHYEVREMPQGLFLKAPQWIVAQSPYKLTNQKLSGYVYVKAIDKSGNERVETVFPKNPPEWYENWPVWAIILIVIGVVYVRFKKHYAKRGR